MKYSTLNIKDIFDIGNKKLCLSADRALGSCYRCKLYNNCGSKVANPAYDALVEKKRELYKEIDKINEHMLTV